MTQLLLFDTSAANSFTPGTPYVEEVTTASRPSGSARVPQNQGGRRLNQHQRGLNQMGDLARLVLLRYDLVARRRAKRLAKEAAANA